MRSETAPAQTIYTLAPAGENTIDFVYQADGYSLASKVSLAALAVFVLYAGYFVRKKKKRC